MVGRSHTQPHRNRSGRYSASVRQPLDWTEHRSLTLSQVTLRHRPVGPIPRTSGQSYVTGSWIGSTVGLKNRTRDSRGRAHPEPRERGEGEKNLVFRASVAPTGEDRGSSRQWEEEERRSCKPGEGSIRRPWWSGGGIVPVPAMASYC
jgi:hypothetical protein